MAFSPSMTENRRLVDRVCSGTGFIDWGFLIRCCSVRFLLSYLQRKLIYEDTGFSGFSDLSS